MPQSTGYHRRYGMWLLNHAEDVLHAPAYTRASHYGPEVRHALFLVWHAANRICAKRLIPYLPTLVEALERHEHLHLTEECRSQLLTMSAATADRLLHAQRACSLRGISTTKAGPLLKQHIPIRTYHQWNETQPGFLEADLVAHCGMDLQGSYLYTLTLTDVATGWTECLPLLNKSQEMVLAAFHHARTLFPFPILGIDTDCGTEFINESIATYCADEHITFTRGRPDLKNDQCFVEQKNGAVVRQVVGYDRLEGAHTSEQLVQLYRALRLYVNYFQPSMKLLSKQREGKHVRRVYDPAKTPLLRLLLSGVLAEERQRELIENSHALDPVRLFAQLRQLQQVVFRCAGGASPCPQSTPTGSIVRFSLGNCTVGTLPGEPEPDQNAYFMPASAPVPPMALPQEPAGARPVRYRSTAEEETRSPQATATTCLATTLGTAQRGLEQSPELQERHTPLPTALTMERAIQSYLQEQWEKGRSPKTIEWHQTALGLFQHYLLTEHHLSEPKEITETMIHGWLMFLRTTPTATGGLRSLSTMATYARSARAFCHWLVRQGHLEHSPIAHGTIPRVGPTPKPSIHILEAKEFGRLLLACRPPGEGSPLQEQATARNRAILWVLLETGISVRELCELRLVDVDRKHGMLRIPGKGGKQGRITLSSDGLGHLLAYLDQHRLNGKGWEEDHAGENHLFLSERGHPLTTNAITLLLARLRKRVGITSKHIGVSLLRQTFAARTLQAGGELEAFQDRVLGGNNAP